MCFFFNYLSYKRARFVTGLTVKIKHDYLPYFLFSSIEFSCEMWVRIMKHGAASLYVKFLHSLLLQPMNVTLFDYGWVCADGYDWEAWRTRWRKHLRSRHVGHVTWRHRHLDCDCSVIPRVCRSLPLVSPAVSARRHSRPRNLRTPGVTLCHWLSNMIPPLYTDLW